MAKENLDIVIGAETAEIKRALKDLDGRFDVLEKDAKELSATVKVGFAAAAAVVVGFTAATIAAVKASNELNRSMASIATLIPGNSERIKELKENVQDLSIEMGKSTEDLSAGLFQVVSAFGDAADSAEKLRIVARASVAGNATTTESLNLLSAVTKGYGDTSASALQKVADLAFVTNKLGQTTFPELAASMGRVVPLAAKLGQSQEELFAVFATLTGVTGNTAEVSTQLAAVQRALIKPTADMTQAIRGLGFTSAEALVEQEGLIGGMQKLVESTDGSSEAVGKLFGRAEALTAVFALSGAQAETFARNLGEAEMASGAADEAFKEQSEGINEFEFELNRLKATFTVVLQRIGDWITQSPKFIGAIKAVTDNLLNFAKVLGLVATTELEKLNEQIDFMNDPSSFEFFETGAEHQAELGRLTAERTALLKAEQDAIIEKSSVEAEADKARIDRKQKEKDDKESAEVAEPATDFEALFEQEAMRVAIIANSKTMELEALGLFHDLKIQQLIDKGAQESEVIRAIAEADFAMKQAVLDKEVKATEQAEKDKKAARQGAIAGTKQLLADIGTAVGTESKRGFEINKKMKIGQTLIDTYSSATSAFSAMSVIPIVGPALGVAAAAAAIAAGLANVNKIRSSKFGGGGGSPSKPSISLGGGGGGAPTPSLTQTREEATQGAQQVSVIVNNPLGDENWDNISEQIVSTINRAGDRNLELNITNRAEQ